MKEFASCVHVRVFAVPAGAITAACVLIVPANTVPTVDCNEFALMICTDIALGTKVAAKPNDSNGIAENTVLLVPPIGKLASALATQQMVDHLASP